MNRIRWVGGCILLFALAVAGVCSQPESARAGAAKVSIRSSSEQIVKGDFFYVVITVSADEEIAGFEGYFTYDQSVLKYITGGSVSSGNDDEIHIRDTEREESAARIKYSVRFLARKAGKCEIALKKPFHVSTADEQQMSVGSAALKVEVLSKKKAERLNRLQQGEGNASPEPPEESQEGREGGSPGKPGEQPSGEPGEKPSAGNPGDVIAPGEEGEDGMPDDGSLDFLDEAQEEQMPSSPPFSQSAGTGLGKTTCIVIICLAVMGLVMIAAFMLGSGRTGEEWMEGEELDESGYEGQEEETGFGMQGTEYTAGDGETAPMPRHTEESMEEIERRLEQKRQWLRKE